MRAETSNSQNKPCVPYLGLLLKDLAFIEEGPKYVKDGHLIHFAKVRKVSLAIDEFLQFKKQAYLFRPIAQFSIFQNLNPITEDECESLANKIEPIFTLNGGKQGKTLKKRITKTDSTSYKLNPSYQEYKVTNNLTNSYLKEVSDLIGNDHKPRKSVIENALCREDYFLIF